MKSIFCPLLVLLQLQFCVAFVASSKSQPSFKRLPIPRSKKVQTGMQMKGSEVNAEIAKKVDVPESVATATIPLHSRSIPKAETGVLDLLKKYPTADGRGVKIAILDTGCDLAAAGLSITSDGKPKYLDFLDCTGGGDVDMNKTVSFDSAESQNVVTGISGKKLTLGEWASGVNELRLGAVRLFHLLPRSVETRIRRERKEAFMIKHEALISDSQISLDTLRGSFSHGGEESKKKKDIKELELLLDQLQTLVGSYEDSGPLMDIVMFHDGDNWRAVIDLEANGDLTKSIPMAPFGIDRQFGELAFGSAVTFCVQVYDEGKTLCVVTDAGSHGTHVCGIAAANFVSEQDEKKSHRPHVNGVAPGAQVLACKIGDGRLGSAETGTGLVRALIAAKKYGCDLVNLSYGEPSWRPDSGRVAQTFSDAVHKWGLTVFTSAGNDGPALSSLGSPGTLSAPITVGAFVSPDMMKDQYSTLNCDEDEPLEGASYYFSSRGPSPDGMNPDICAPGGAISPIPRHALQGKAQYHGTSMSSPNACGVAACVLSALKLKGIDNCGPIELRRGLLNSASNVDITDPFAQGAGLISAVSAVDYIFSNHGKDGQNLAVDVSIPSRDGARGIYIRDLYELEGPMTFSVLVQPRFSHAIKRTTKEMQELLELELDLELKPSETWVKCPESVTLFAAQERNGQTFSVRLDTKDLNPGAHFARIDAIDASDPNRGSLFSVPITVIVPHSRFTTDESTVFELNDDEYFKKNGNGIDYSSTFKLTQGLPNRRFITVPQSAEWATIKLKSTSPHASGKSPQNVMLHAIPFVRGDLPNKRIQLKRVFQVKEGVEQVYHMRVKGGATLELCLQLLWLASSAPANVIAEIEFHSLNAFTPTLVSSQPVTIAAATEFARLGASAPLRSEQLKPMANLKFVERAIRPEKYDIIGGSIELDVLPPSDAEIQASGGTSSENMSTVHGTQIYEMRLLYKFEIDGDKPVSVTPSVPSLFNQLYDSPLDSQLWVLKDNNLRILAYGGAMHHADSVSLKKGDYTLSLLLRHPNRNVLEQMKDVPCQLKMDLPTPLACTVYSHLDKASTPNVKDGDRNPLTSVQLRKGAHKDIYVSRPTEDIPSFVIPGDQIVGALSLDKDRVGATSMKLVYAVPPKAKAKKASESETKTDDKKQDESIEDVVFKAKLNFLSSLRSKDAEAYKKLAVELREQKPSSIPLLSELLSFARKAPLPSTESNEDEWRAKEIEEVYEAMKDAPIDEIVLAQYYGINELDDEELNDDKDAKQLKKDMKEQRNFLQTILFSRAATFGKIAEAEGKEKEAGTGVEAFDVAVKEMKKWVNVKDFDEESDKVLFWITLARHAKLCQLKKATALSILLKARKDLSDKAYKEITKEIIKIYESFEGMNHLVENANEEIFNRFPVIDTPL